RGPSAKDRRWSFRGGSFAELVENEIPFGERLTRMPRLFGFMATVGIDPIHVIGVRFVPQTDVEIVRPTNPAPVADAIKRAVERGDPNRAIVKNFLQLPARVADLLRRPTPSIRLQ